MVEPADRGGCGRLFRSAWCEPETALVRGGGDEDHRGGDRETGAGKLSRLAPLPSAAGRFHPTLQRDHEE